MPGSCKKNNDKIGLVAVLLFSFFFFSPLSVPAQSDDDSATMIDEIKVAPMLDTVDPEKDKQYFRELTGEDSLLIHQRQLPAGQLKKIKGQKDFWYADATIKKKKIKEYLPLIQRSWFQTLLWLVIVGGFAWGLMWWLAGSRVGLFRKKDEELSSGDETGSMPEDIFAINYQKEIDKAAANGNFRLAVRLLYLRLLKNLSDKNIIHYKQDKTNFDYLLQLHPTPYYKQFFRLTRHYEYSWYGHFDVAEETFSIIRGDFDQLDREIIQ